MQLKFLISFVLIGFVSCQDDDCGYCVDLDKNPEDCGEDGYCPNNCYEGYEGAKCNTPIKSYCAPGTWGKDCMNVCGQCMVVSGNGKDCDEYGLCPFGCEDDYTGRHCNETECNPACINGAQCIGPNICDCGEDINLVRPVCEDIRLRGLLGSLIAIITISAGILVCKFGSESYKRKKERRS